MKIMVKVCPTCFSTNIARPKNKRTGNDLGMFSTGSFPYHCRTCNNWFKFPMDDYSWLKNVNIVVAQIQRY